MKNKVLSDMAPILSRQYGEGKKTLILEYAVKRWEQLCRDNADQSKAVKAHTVAKIYPCIALYDALQHVGVEREAARDFLDRSFSEMAEPQAAAMRAMCRIPGFYRLMPRIFAFVTRTSFGEKAGFRATFYPTDATRCKFDMTRCVYCEECRRLGYPELIVCFCHTDDVTDGHMHPKLIWNRTKIMGDGADCCDFDLYIDSSGR